MRHDQLTQASAMTQYRQLIEYPPVTDEARQKFQGTLKQYRKWEAEEHAKIRAAGQADPKGKKDGKKEVKKPDNKADKKKKGAAEEPTVQQVELPPEPAFAQDLHLSAFEHHVKVLQLRALQTAAPSIEELLSCAMTADQTTQEAVEAEAIAEAERAHQATPRKKPDGPVREDWILPSPKASPQSRTKLRSANPGIEPSENDSGRTFFVCVFPV